MPQSARNEPDVFRVRAARPASDLELYGLPFVEGLDLPARDRGAVDVHVGSVVPLDEPEAFGLVEPFDRSLRHDDEYDRGIGPSQDVPTLVSNELLGTSRLGAR